MKSRVIALLVFLVGVTGAFVYFRFEPVFSSRSVETLSEKELKQKLDESWNNKDTVVESRLMYDKKITVVHVGELNTDAYAGALIQNIDTRKVSLNPQTKSMYFYEEGELPEQQDELLVVYDVNSLDVLLKEDVHNSGEDVYLDFDPIQFPETNNDINHLIRNEGRLFLNLPMQISLTDNGTIQVKFDGKEQNLTGGENAEFKKDKQDGGLLMQSKVVVTNYGQWDTINMKYVETSGNGE